MFHNVERETYRYVQRREDNNKGRQRKYLELMCEYNQLEPHEAHDIRELATHEKAPNDAVFRTGGNINGKWSPGRWICMWELSPVNDFVIWSHKRIIEESKDYEQRKSIRAKQGTRKLAAI
jgi:hypothetical protein